MLKVQGQAVQQDFQVKSLKRNMILESLFYTLHLFPPYITFPLLLFVIGTVPVPDFAFLIVAVVIVDVFVDALLVILSFGLRGFMSDVLLLVLFLNLLK